MNTGFGASMLAMRNPLTAGMKARSSIREFAKEHGTLTKSGEETLNALDRLEKEQIERNAQRRQNAVISKKRLRQASIFDSLSAPRAANSRQAASTAKAYEAKAISLSQQARAAAAMGDDETAAELQHKALEAAQSANQMHAQEMQLARREAQERKAKLDREAKDRIEARKAKKAAQEALLAIKQHRIGEAHTKESAAKNHLAEARKAKQKRQQAELEAWSTRVQEGQFWIRQMQLAKQGKHPAQQLAQSCIDTYREVSIPATVIAPDF